MRLRIDAPGTTGITVTCERCGLEWQVEPGAHTNYEHDCSGVQRAREALLKAQAGYDEAVKHAREVHRFADEDVVTRG